ncbi:serine hydrolase [Lactobacillus sp. ESL0791]|uniref:serine hydrolase domain-containing protein n=1 Tax=Lactobacillus sp. ESL0791 TaxID=2983234 RepID=UPI0023F85B78|nr:serine hydrolase domain-containing protein [Lactobacillus sp. ESL0791]MDF7639723.1 serine hydrolase [Lactobacillus sp. ESL0791]
MRKFVRRTMAKHHVRGSVVVVKDGVPQQISYGYAWYNKRLHNGNHKVIYPTGSLQKVVTAAMLMQIMNEKKGTKKEFNQYTKISRWYPKLKNAHNISVGNLLTHTSGIKVTNTEINRGYNYSEKGAINWVISNANLAAYDKVNAYHYNNTNYILLAGIIRKLTGKSYNANFKSRIVKKLGLKHTYLYQSIPKAKTDAISYYSNGRNNYHNPSYVTRDFASQIVGAGNMFTTPKEYYKIQVGLTNGKILDQTSFNYLTSLDSKVTNYSGGMRIKKGGKLKLAYGNLHGTHFGMWVQLTSDNQNGIVMFLNQTNNNENSEKAVGYKILKKIKANTFASK